MVAIRGGFRHRRAVRFVIRAGRHLAADVLLLRGAVRAPAARRNAEAGAAGRLAVRASASSSSASTGSRPPLPTRRQCRPGSAGSRSSCLALPRRLSDARDRRRLARSDAIIRSRLSSLGRGVGDHGVAARGLVHRLRLEPGRRRPCPDAAAETQRIDRDLRPVSPRRPAVGGNLARSPETLAGCHP